LEQRLQITHESIIFNICLPFSVCVKYYLTLIYRHWSVIQLLYKDTSTENITYRGMRCDRMNMNGESALVWRKKL